MKLILFLLLSCPLLLQAQMQFGQVQGYLGTSLYPSSKQKLLSGFGPGVTVGGGVSKMFKEKFVYSPNIEFSTASKEHYTFSLLTLHNNLKYYPLHSKKIRPYVMAIANVSFMNLHQHAFSTTDTPDGSYSGTAPSDIPVSEVTYREPDLKLKFAPTFGLGAGIGFDLTVRLKWVPFIQYSYVNYFSQSSGLINNNFKNNTSNLSIQNISVGVRYHLFVR
jgi:hypothetical protein